MNAYNSATVVLRTVLRIFVDSQSTMNPLASIFPALRASARKTTSALSELLSEYFLNEASG
eukprot:12390709-Prorocentrum_lima.AAC.1